MFNEIIESLVCTITSRDNVKNKNVSCNKYIFKKERLNEHVILAKILTALSIRQGPHFILFSLVYFFPPRFWSGNLFLIAPFPDRCLLVPFSFIWMSFQMYLLLCYMSYNTFPIFIEYPVKTYI